jgi:hypothetical protein
MIRKLFFLSVVFAAYYPRVLTVAQTTAGTQTTAPAPVSVTEIVEKNTAARGGLQAWRAVQSMSMTGEMDAGHDVKLPYTLELKRPRKLRLELQFQGKTAVQVYDGARGWKVRPFLGKTTVEEFSPIELRAAAAETELDGALIDYTAKGYKLELAGIEPIEGKDAYKLKVAMPGNVVRHIWVDAGTFLEVKVDGTRRMDGRDRVMETYLRDYKLESGLLIPHVLETAVEGVKARQMFVVQNVVVNPQLSDARFAKP